jgi:DNA-binding FadR family transcriptional regulator
MNEHKVIAALLTVAHRVGRPITPPATHDDWKVIFEDYKKFLNALRNEDRGDIPDGMKTVLKQVEQLRKDRSA